MGMQISKYCGNQESSFAKKLTLEVPCDPSVTSLDEAAYTCSLQVSPLVSGLTEKAPISVLSAPTNIALKDLHC